MSEHRRWATGPDRAVDVEKLQFVEQKYANFAETDLQRATVLALCHALVPASVS